MNEQAPSASTPSVSSLHAALDFISELSGVIASHTELKPILEWIVQRITGMLSADEGSIKLLDADALRPGVHTLVRKPRPGLEAGSWEPVISMSVMGYLEKGGALSSPDLLGDPRFAGLKGVQSRVRAVLAVPLKLENRITGMLAVTNRSPGRQWSAEDLQLLAIVAGNSAEAIEKARLRAEAEEKRRLEQERREFEREFSQAREIQMSLVPSAPLILAPWEVHGLVVPARQVGGDYFDYFPVGESRFGITIADVSGKGLSAALMMANVRGALRAVCNGKVDIPEAIQIVNRQVAASASLGRFVTLFYAEVDAERGILRYTNAGHNYPLIRRADGTLEELTEGGIMLGPFLDSEYDLGEARFDRGDALLLYSDGISEAMDSHDREFGDERLRSLWKSCCTLRTGEILDCLLRDVTKFRGSAGQSDDMTAVVVGPQSTP